ncbi:MAG: MotA/TolQ/ExbB proton channel family protein [Thermoguttaceae bacterium]
MLATLSDNFPWIILAFAVIHAGLFSWLAIAYQQKTGRLGAHLESLVRGFSSRSDTDRTHSVDDDINVFLADLQDVIRNPAKLHELEDLRTRLIYKDEARPYLKTASFERIYSLSRTLIEIYPLLGILGTVLAIGCGLAAQANAAPESGAAIDAVVKNFGNSIWSTFMGLLFAVIYMILNAFWEPSFQRLMENQANVREIITAAKCRLGEGAARTPVPQQQP